MSVQSRFTIILDVIVASVWNWPIVNPETSPELPNVVPTAINSYHWAVTDPGEVALVRHRPFVSPALIAPDANAAPPGSASGRL